MCIGTYTYNPDSSWVPVCNTSNRRPRLLPQGALSCHGEHSPATGSTPGCSSALSKPPPLLPCSPSLPPLSGNVTPTVGLYGLQPHLSLFTGTLLISTLHARTLLSIPRAGRLGQADFSHHVCTPTPHLTQCPPPPPPDSARGPHLADTLREGCPSFPATARHTSHSCSWRKFQGLLLPPGA